MFRSLLSKLRGSRGMTLVELLVVMAILSVVMMAVMSLFIPAVQSTSTSTQVSDVQANLRLAMKAMTRDLLHAGFMVPDNPIIFEASATPTTAENPDPTDFTIRTRAVGNDFARVTGAAGVTNITLTVSDPDMVANFSVDTKVRLYEPIKAQELIYDTGSSSDRAYNVESTGSDTIVISGNGILNADDVPAETVVMRVRDNSQPALSTIRFRLNSTDQALERVVNGTTQVIARNVNFANFTYAKTDEGRVSWVDIELRGVTKGLKPNDAIAGVKERSVRTSVKLRNVF